MLYAAHVSVDLVSKRYLDITRDSRARRFEAASLRHDGLKLREIGERMGVGAEQARTMANAGDWIMAYYFASLNDCAEMVARGVCCE
jgi:hypothetical protein